MIRNHHRSQTSPAPITREDRSGANTASINQQKGMSDLIQSSGEWAGCQSASRPTRHGWSAPGKQPVRVPSEDHQDPELFPTERNPNGLTAQQGVDVAQVPGLWSSESTSVNPQQAPRGARRPWGFGGLCRLPSGLEATPAWWPAPMGGHKLELAQAHGRHHDVGHRSSGDVRERRDQPVAPSLRLLSRFTSPPQAPAPRAPWPQWGEGIARRLQQSRFAPLLEVNGRECRASMPLAATTGRLFCVAVVVSRRPDDEAGGGPVTPSSPGQAAGRHSKWLHLVRAFSTARASTAASTFNGSDEPVNRGPCFKPTQLLRRLWSDPVKAGGNPSPPAWPTSPGRRGRKTCPVACPAAVHAASIQAAGSRSALFHWLTEQGEVPEEDLWNTSLVWLLPWWVPAKDQAPPSASSEGLGGARPGKLAELWAGPSGGGRGRPAEQLKPPRDSAKVQMMELLSRQKASGASFLRMIFDDPSTAASTRRPQFRRPLPPIHRAGRGAGSKQTPR